MSLLQVFNSSVKKHGSFEDWMICLAQKAQARNVKLGFVFPAIKTASVREKIESCSAKIHQISDAWWSFSFVRKVMKLVKEENYQVIDFHFCYSFNFVLLFIFLRAMGRKVLFHYHGEIQPIERIKALNRYISRLRLLLLFVDIIIPVSYANRRYLEALHILKKHHVVYNGVNIEMFRNMNNTRDFRKENNIEEESPLITSIGSLIPRKGIEVLLKAMKEVVKVFPDARCVVIGGGDVQNYRQIARDSDVGGNVLFTGLVKEYPFHILKAADIYVSASFAESFGLSIAEAQLLGIPVIATRVGGVPEVVNEGKTGLLVDAGDCQALAQAIIELVQNSELREQFSRAGPGWIESKFNLSDRVEELLDVSFC